MLIPKGTMSQDPLEAFQQRLHAHFSWLRAQRDATGPGRPIFALEHGLDADGRELLAGAVREGIARGLHPRVEWLPYVVYAAELGYRYTGDEYWQTFAAESPGWAEHGNPDYIPRKFRAFAAEFGGAKPSGRWANHFNRIAWPITHAVLPKDLQRHLARLLYEIRHEISMQMLASPEELGRRLAARAFHTSSRFQKFAENTGLLGLVAAELLSDEHEESPALLRATLDRIVEDLSAERQAKSWLRGAQRSATAVRVRGLTDAGSAGTTSTTEGGRRNAGERPATTDPTLWLRLQSDGSELEMELPDLSELAARLPSLQEELSRKRCRVSGRSRPLARGQVMHAGQRVRLDRRPEPDGSVLEVENGSSAVTELLRDHCLLPLPPWLFRDIDGRAAKQLRSRVVRPGGSYLYVLPQPIPQLAPSWIREVAIATGGLRAYRIDVPETLDATSRNVFSRLGLASSADLSIRPAGVVPADWDGEGVVEWMVGDDAILAIQSARKPSNMTVEIDGSVASVDWPDGESCIYLQLGPLPVGTHRCRFHVTFSDGSTQPAGGDLSAIIRTRPSGGSSLGYGLRLLASPAQPYLTELWDGEAYIEAIGPAGARATATCEFRSKPEDRTLAVVSFKLALPTSKEAWLQAFRKHVRSKREVEDIYDESDLCVLSLSHPDLGTSALRLERAFTPLRWSIHSDRNGATARLINNSSVDEPTIELFTSASPNRPSKTVDGEEIGRASAGGLLVARADGTSSAVILPPEVHRPSDLQRISSVPDLDQYRSCSAATIRAIIRDCGTWLEAELPANLWAERLLHTVVRGFAGRACALVGGHYWSQVERQAREDPEDLRRSLLVDAMGRHPADKRLADELSQGIERFRLLDLQQRAEVLCQILRGTVRVDRELLDPAAVESLLQLASEPGRLSSRPDAEVDEAIELALARPIVLRAARMVVLCVHVAEDHDTGSVYRGWAWQ